MQINICRTPARDPNYHYEVVPLHPDGEIDPYKKSIRTHTSELEAEIDRLIYDLYELTENEMATWMTDIAYLAAQFRAQLKKLDFDDIAVRPMPKPDCSLPCGALANPVESRHVGIWSPECEMSCRMVLTQLARLPWRFCSKGAATISPSAISGALVCRTVPKQKMGPLPCYNRDNDRKDIEHYGRM